MVIPPSASITYNTIYTQSHANIYNLINNRSNVPDPARPNDAGTTHSRKFVYSRKPRHKGRNFEGFPYIIIPYDDVTQGKATADASKANLIYDIDIIIITKDSDSDSSGSPKGGEQLSTISDDIIKTINANIKTLNNYGLKKPELNSDNDYDELDGKTIFIREFILTFSGLQKVVA